MKILVNQEIKRLFCTAAGIMAAFCLLIEGIVWYFCSDLPAAGAIAVLFILMFLLITAAGFKYFGRQHALLEDAVEQIQVFLDGDTDARIVCDEEGEIYRLFHSINTLAAVLMPRFPKKSREKGVS